MCVWCPLWPVQRLRSERLGLEGQVPEAVASRGDGQPPPRESPIVIFTEVRRGFQVIVCSPEAALWGIRVGMPLGEVRSLLPIPTDAASRSRHRNKATLGPSPALPLLKRANPIVDRSRLQSLALHCHRYSPLAGLEEGAAPESIWLDISGSEALFGGEQELACDWLGTMTEPTQLRLLRSTTQKRHLLELLRLQNERRIVTTGVQGIRMEAVEIGLPPVRQATLFGDDTDETDPQLLAELVDRLSSRLGRQGVLRPQLTSDPQPEFACESFPWLVRRPSVETEESISLSRLRCRPLRLLTSPEPLSVEGVSVDGLPTRVNRSPVVQISGPERIEAGWWRGPDVKRDYYRLDLAQGTALWVFVDRDTGQWFLHGLFA